MDLKLLWPSICTTPPVIERHLTVAGNLLLHHRLSLPGSTLPSTDQLTRELTSQNAAYSALQVLLSRVLPSLMVLSLQYVTMPASTSRETARTTSNLSMYNESLISHLYEGLTKVLQSYLPAPCRGLAASPSKKTNSETRTSWVFKRPHRWSRLRYALPAL